MQLIFTTLLMLLVAHQTAFAQPSANPVNPAPVVALKPIAQTVWGKVPTDLQKVLAPLQKDWDSLDGLQQQRLMATARQYPKMQPIQQERFQERIGDWAKLTRAQRIAARAKYQDLAKLPPEKQHAIKERWLEKQANAKAESAAASATNSLR